MNDIPKSQLKTEICPYCGKSRNFLYREGYTSINTNNGIVKYIDPVSDDGGCDCILGQLQHKNKKIHIKPQCLNCVYYDILGYCTNEDEKKEIFELFELEGKLRVKDKTKKCKHYKLSLEKVFCDMIDLY